MTNDEFENRVESWQRRFEGMAEDMMATTNEAGQYPQIDFGPLIIAFEGIVTGLRDSRKEEPSLILVPGVMR